MPLMRVKREEGVLCLAFVSFSVVTKRGGDHAPVWFIAPFHLGIQYMRVGVLSEKRECLLLHVRQSCDGEIRLSMGLIDQGRGFQSAPRRTGGAEKAIRLSIDCHTEHRRCRIAGPYFRDLRKKQPGVAVLIESVNER